MMRIVSLVLLFSFWFGVDDLAAQDECQITFIMETADVFPDQSEVCLDVTVRDFENIWSVVLPVSYPAEFLEFNRVDHSAFDGITIESDTAGVLLIKWEDPEGIGAINLIEDTDRLLTLCFDIRSIPPYDMWIRFNDYTGRSTSLITNSEPFIMDDCGIDGSLIVPCSRNPLDFLSATFSNLEEFCPRGSYSIEIAAFLYEDQIPFNFQIYEDGVVKDDVSFTRSIDKYFFDYEIDQPYDLVLTNSAGCQIDSTITFREREGETLELNRVTTGNSCEFESDGYIQFYLASLDWPNTYIKWDHGPETPFNRGNAPHRIEGLSAGTYTVTVSHQTCEIIKTFVIEDIPQFELNSNITYPSCGAFNGSIRVNASPADAYEYRWLNINQEGSELVDVGPGAYQVEVMSSSGCTKVETIIIDSLSTLELNLLDSGQDPCSGNQDIMVDPLYTDGRMLTYYWSDGRSTTGVVDMISNPEPGNYWVYAENNTCQSDTMFFTVPEVTPAISLDSIIVTEPSCMQPLGQIEMVFASFDDFEIDFDGDFYYDPVISDIPPGSYRFTISNPDGCSVNASVDIPEAEEVDLVIDDDRSSLMTCAGNPSEVFLLKGDEYTLTDASGLELSLPLALDIGDHWIYGTHNSACVDSVLISITELVLPELSLSSILPDYLCSDESFAFLAEQAYSDLRTDWIISWNQQLVSPTTEIILEPGLNELEIISPDGCVIRGEHMVVRYDLELDSLYELSSTGSDNPAFTLPIMNHDLIASVQWQPEQPVDCQDDRCSDVIFSSTESERFEFSVIDTFGCATTGVLNLVVEIPDSTPVDTMIITTPSNPIKVYIPNALRVGSPSNGNLCVFASTEQILSTEIRLYDRWGGLRISESGQLQGGQFCVQNASIWAELPSGVYVYTVLLMDSSGSTEQVTGDITVFR